MGPFSLALVALVCVCRLSVADEPTTRADLLVNGLDFKIAVFSDLHFGENEDSFGIPQDINSTALMEFVLEVEQPDFAVLNGDLITGENTFRFNSTKYVDRIVAPLVNKSIPWASTYGNHDSKYNLTRNGIFREEHKYPLSRTQHGPRNATDGVTNYLLPIRTAPGTKPLALLWFFDSRGGSRNDPSNTDNIPNFVSNKTVQWFRSASEQAERQWGVLPSLAFVHIPMTAFLDLQSSVMANVSGPRYPGLNADVPPAVQGQADQSVPFMRALLDTPGLHSIYSGHDHGDSWCGRWLNSTLPGKTANSQRPILCFCKHSGFGGYGTWNRGVRMVQLQFDYLGGFGVDTWVRMENGRVVTAVSLNQTYGKDVYSTADGGYHPY